MITLIGTVIPSIPSGTKWPSSFRRFNMYGNNVEETKIEPDAFYTASNLEIIQILEQPEKGLTVATNGFRITSKKASRITIDYNPVHFDANAFGNEDEGELWSELDVKTNDFPEDVFRQLIKTHFDLGHTSLFNDEKSVMIESCDTCDIAWLYKDAHNYGLEAYKALLGSNVLCPNNNTPILDITDQDFIDLMEGCP